MDDVVLASSDQPPSGRVAARESGDRCQMHHREGTRRNRLHLAATVGLLLLSACTGGNAVEPNPTGGSSSRATAPPESPTPSESPPTVSESAAATSDVEAAYQRYLDTTVAAMETGDPTRIEGATGQALAAAQARVAALSSNDRVAKGAFRPAIQSLEVDADTAELRDCYAVDITEHDKDTDEQLADRNGTRFAASVVLEQSDEDWVVAEFNPGEFCVPDGLAAEIEDRYLAFWAAVSAAGRPPNPDHPDLVDTAAGEQLEGLRKQISGFRDDGHEVRDDTVSHPAATQISENDTVAIVRDCRDLDPDGGLYDAETGELVHGGAEPGQRDLWETRLEVIGGAWKVVDADLIEGDSACEPAAS
jgi:hypothetical protein